MPKRSKEIFSIFVIFSVVIQDPQLVRGAHRTVGLWPALLLRVRLRRVPGRVCPLTRVATTCAALLTTRAPRACSPNRRHVLQGMGLRDQRSVSVPFPTIVTTY